MAEDKTIDQLPIDGKPPESFFEGKRALKRYLISLPFEEKIRRVIEMQKMEKLLKKDRTKEIFVWRL
jgi:hypothetical protein